MRIRSTKPEFWRSERIAAVRWSLVYDGPADIRVNAVAPMSSMGEYVYMLFDAADRLLYVGRSSRPADRLPAHRRKTWGSDIAGLCIIRIAEDPANRRRDWRADPPHTSAFERAAISQLNPLHNIAGRAVANAAHPIH